MMHEDLSAEQHDEVQALVADLEREGGRVGVDWGAAAPVLRALAPVVERRISDTEVEVGMTLDVMGMLATLRNLPDGVGTNAFLAAFRLHSAAGDPPLA